MKSLRSTQTTVASLTRPPPANNAQPLRMPDRQIWRVRTSKQVGEALAPRKVPNRDMNVGEFKTFSYSTRMR